VVIWYIVPVLLCFIKENPDWDSGRGIYVHITNKYGIYTWYADRKHLNEQLYCTYWEIRYMQNDTAQLKILG
jgi:hypothetical protein